MFDLTNLPDALDVVSGDDAELVADIGISAQVESAILARALLAMVELYDRRHDAACAAPEKKKWVIDVTSAVESEIAAIRQITKARAHILLDTGLLLRRRFPLLGAQFLAGRVTYRVVNMVLGRTELLDDSIVGLIDAEVVKALSRLGGLSDVKLAEQIDRWVMEIDYLAVRAKRDPDKERFLDIEARDDGMADLTGTLRATDAVALTTRLNQLADSVCKDDPRTKAHRRADAAGALAAGATTLACECGLDDCPVAGKADGALPALEINMVAEEATVKGEGSNPGHLPGFGPLRADVVHKLAQTAKLRPISRLRDWQPEPHYRPSADLARAVRSRDLTCRFPGCEVSAWDCDIDHSVPWPLGPTHPSNLNCKCRRDHLLKTFYLGEDGWAETQLPDGTIIFRSPSGLFHVTKPLGAVYFSGLAEPSPMLDLPISTDPPSEFRGLAMPTRKRTREQDRAARIAAERKHNYETVKPPEPPPF